jgi:hypothetical protein
MQSQETSQTLVLYLCCVHTKQTFYIIENYNFIPTSCRVVLFYIVISALNVNTYNDIFHFQIFSPGSFKSTLFPLILNFKIVSKNS